MNIEHVLVSGAIYNDRKLHVYLRYICIFISYEQERNCHICRGKQHHQHMRPTGFVSLQLREMQKEKQKKNDTENACTFLQAILLHYAYNQMSIFFLIAPFLLFFSLHFNLSVYLFPCFSLSHSGVCSVDFYQFSCMCFLPNRLLNSCVRVRHRDASGYKCIQMVQPHMVKPKENVMLFLATKTIYEIDEKQKQSTEVLQVRP